MLKDTYKNKLLDLLDSNQFSESKGTNDSIVMKIEKDINNELLAIRKTDEKSETLHKNEVHWGQPATLYGLAKMHKENTTL